MGHFDRQKDNENAFQLELVDSGGGNVQIRSGHFDINPAPGDPSLVKDHLTDANTRAGFAFGEDWSFEAFGSCVETAMHGLESRVGTAFVVGGWVYDVRDGDDRLYGPARIHVAKQKAGSLPFAKWPFIFLRPALSCVAARISGGTPWRIHPNPC
ncbi:hypothetical protein OS190_06360 [Sulfitobacter sp. F26204]|uniref:hypothetical protein n=1 Tax=Sulfitobacter sp. F26204 TaxID=2996014 RepID=UPI00225E3406|nr:hypothetical protein [Sulfitobacter sp. F26204]MCX7559186.1 hypothetical protein [Sulfitobacter sp. F26204]